MAIKQAVQFALLFDDPDEAAKVLDQIRNTLQGSVTYLTKGYESTDGVVSEPQVKGKVLLQWSSAPVTAQPETYMPQSEGNVEDYV